MKPNEARKPENTVRAYLKMKMKTKTNRIYPEIHKGSQVNMHQKRKPNEKGHVSCGVIDHVPLKTLQNITGWQVIELIKIEAMIKA